MPTIAKTTRTIFILFVSKMGNKIIRTPVIIIIIDINLSIIKSGFFLLNFKALFPVKTKYKLKIPTANKKGLSCFGKTATNIAIIPDNIIE